MKKNNCSGCGVEYSQVNPKYSCPSCDDSYCPECVEIVSETNKRKSDKKRHVKIEKAKNLDEYKDLICPNCNTEIRPF